MTEIVLYWSVLHQHTHTAVSRVSELTDICYSRKHHAASAHADAQSVSEWQSPSQPGQRYKADKQVQRVVLNGHRGVTAPSNTHVEIQQKPKSSFYTTEHSGLNIDICQSGRLQQRRSVPSSGPTQTASPC